jgi:transposase InsO family protein
MFNTAIAAQGIPYQLSSDNDPQFRYHRWRANLRILEIQEIKSVPYTPCSHLFIERLIGTLRREFLDHGFFWNANDLERKLEGYRQYYKANRVQTSKGDTPPEITRETTSRCADLRRFRWKCHCRGLYELPVAA